MRVQIPPRLWAAANGRREFVKSLRTADIYEANRLKASYVAEFQRQITALEYLRADPRAEVIQKALEFRDAITRHGSRVLVYGEQSGEPAWTVTDEMLSQASDEAQEIAERLGDDVADRFHKLATGQGIFLKDVYERWLTERSERVTGQTLSQDRMVLRAFLTWADSDVTVHEVTRRKAGEYVGWLLTSESGISGKTANRYRSTLSSQWKWLIGRGHVETNPWLGHDLAKRSTRGTTIDRGQWNDAALAKLLSGAFTPKYQQTLHDLTRLAVTTGARLDELCALKTSDLDRRTDGWWFTIREGKSKAAVREVPVHVAVAHVFEQRRKSKDGFVFSSLTPGGPDNKRGWNVSKAFTRYRRELGLNERGQVFHSLRNSFTEVMEAAGVPESTVKLIIGHTRTSLTFGHYSKGVRVDLRAAMNKLRYSKEVMRLIRG